MPSRKAGTELEIHLQQESVVNQHTGEVSAPSEYVENLRALEREIQRSDDAIVTLKADLKVARESREKEVAQLRAAIREGTVMPLLEAAEGDDAAGGDEERE